MKKISQQIKELEEKELKRLHNYKIVDENGKIIEKFRVKQTAEQTIGIYRKQYYNPNLKIEAIEHDKE